MGHVWTWLETNGDFFTESEKSSCCPSLLGSTDSSLDLDLELGSWRETEETVEEELEESSNQEEESPLETSDPLAWESANKADQEETGKYKQDTLLRFLSEVTHLMEPLCIGSTYLAQGPRAICSAGEQKGRGNLTHQGDISGPPFSKEEKVGEESHLQIFKEHTGENWVLQVERLPVMSWAAEEVEEVQGLCEEAEGSLAQDHKPQAVDRDSGKKMLHILVESAGEMDGKEECSLELMNQTFFSWKTLEEEVPQSVQLRKQMIHLSFQKEYYMMHTKEDSQEGEKMWVDKKKYLEVAMENQEQDEDWKDSNFHLSYSNDDSSSCGTPLMSSPSISSASLPSMQLSQDDSLEQRLLFRKTLLSIWKMVAGHRYSGPFLKPVSEKQAPGYKDVVKRPVDLSTIKRRLSKGQIQNMIQFQRDLMLMFQNAVMYNSSNHHIHRIAVEMQREVLEQLQMLGEALLCSEEMQGFVRRC